MISISALRRLPTSDGLLVIEAALGMTWSNLKLWVMPFQRIAPTLGQLQVSPVAPDPNQPPLTAKKVAWAIQAAARRLPWPCKCLSQAMTAKAMLRRRGVSTTLYVGVSKDEAQSFLAHAWLNCGSYLVTGGQQSHQFMTMMAFSD